MLNIYSADWCPHCKKAINWLKKNNIPFEVINVDKASPELIARLVEINGGEDWVIPSLEYKGKWREGKVFEEKSFKQDLINLGLKLT